MKSIRALIAFSLTGLLVLSALGPSAQGRSPDDRSPARAPKDLALYPPYLLKDIAPGPADAQIGMEAEQAGTLTFFTAASGGDDVELWATTGAPEGTRRVKDINLGPAGSHPSHLTRSRGDGSKLYFFADDGTSGRELWVSDGTSAGTARVKDMNPGPGDGAPAGPGQPMGATSSLLFFAAQDSEGNLEPWATDGTTAGTREVHEINAQGGSDPANFTWIGGRVVFSATSDELGREPWTSDGTSSGTSMLADVQPGPGSSKPYGFGHAPGGGTSDVLFGAEATPGDTELYKAPVPSGPVTRLKDINPGPGPSNPVDVLGHGGFKSFFIAGTTPTDRQVWVTDGTEAGTRPATELDSGADPRDLTQAEFSGFLFSADSGGVGRELWQLGVDVSDPQVSVAMVDVEPGPAGSDPRDLQRYLAFHTSGEAFVADTAASGSEVWTTTSPGQVRRATDIAAGPADGVERVLGQASQAVLLLVGDNGTTGRALYAVDLEFRQLAHPTSLTAHVPRRIGYRTALRKQIVVRVRINKPAIATRPVTGKVRVYDRGRAVGRAMAHDGKARVRIRKMLGVGKHRLVVRYEGSGPDEFAIYLPSRSKPITVRVLPKSRR